MPRWYKTKKWKHSHGYFSWNYMLRMTFAVSRALESDWEFCSIPLIYRYRTLTETLNAILLAFRIASFTIVYLTVSSGADQRKHQSSASLDFVQGIHRGPVNSPRKWPVTRKMFPFDDVIMDSAATAIVVETVRWRHFRISGPLCKAHTVRDFPPHRGPLTPNILGFLLILFYKQSVKWNVLPIIWDPCVDICISITPPHQTNELTYQFVKTIKRYFIAGSLRLSTNTISELSIKCFIYIASQILTINNNTWVSAPHFIEPKRGYYCPFRYLST